MTARSVAAQAVLRVLRDGAFGAAALSAELERARDLDERDRALATELLYGTLRLRGALEERLAEHAARGLKDLAVRAELLVAAYQILLLDRVPAFAAVNSAVSAVRAKRGARVAGFANAILRKLAAGEKLDPAEAAKRSVAPWLLAALERSVGAEEASLLILPELEKKVGLRLISGRSVPAWLEESERGKLSPRARLIHGEGDPRKREGYAEGAFVVQEEGAQAIGLALGA
ncbi:MAG TPA: transcription antitermination factor NusB, partial [Polyangiaceae bacterium]